MTFSPQNPTPRRPRRARSAEECAVLAEARAAQHEVHAAEARKLAAAVAWAGLHEVDDSALAETWGNTPITLGGEGAPLLGTGCVAEFAAVIGTTTHGGRAYLADALELAHRLPNLYAAVQSGDLPAWKARRIAGQTTVLPPEAAADLDLRITPVAAGLSARATERFVEETIATVMPDYAQEKADQHAQQKVVVDHRQVSFSGTSDVYGALDLADALDLDAALNRGAEALARAGNPASLDVRRAMALGQLARGERADAAPGRQVTLLVHLPSDTTNPTAVIENGGRHLLTQAQVASWCGNPDARVVVKPVIDLHDTLAVGTYAIPSRLAEQVELRDGTCVFVHCDRAAVATQKDHTTAWADGGPTSTENLACLCQHHHNLKTHGGWTYVATTDEDGHRAYRWRSPHGYEYLRTRHGTRDLTPRPLEPPGAAA